MYSSLIEGVNCLKLETKFLDLGVKCATSGS